jgi:hypothetical protein
LTWREKVDASMYQAAMPPLSYLCPPFFFFLSHVCYFQYTLHLFFIEAIMHALRSFFPMSERKVYNDKPSIYTWTKTRKKGTLFCLLFTIGPSPLKEHWRFARNLMGKRWKEKKNDGIKVNRQESLCASIHLFIFFIFFVLSAMPTF